MRVPRFILISVAGAVRGLVVKNGRPALFTSGEEGDYPPLRVSGGYLVAGATGRKLTVTNGKLACNDSATV
jgi:hypothetical protein